jgi:DNA-binding CsgD family transcriptional regulator/tetratricopeptide (TPR) repeat protein
VRDDVVVVGRDGECAALRRMVAAARSGRGGVALVSGEGGIGKTAVVSAALAGEEVVAGAASADDGSALAPLVELAVGLLSCGARLTSSAMGAYAPVASLLVSGLEGVAPSPTGAAPHPVLMADAVLRLWATVPVPRRPVFLVEDVHWADDISWAVLRRMVRVAPATGAVLVATSRPEGPRWSALERMTRTGEATHLALQPLGAADVARLVAGRLAVDPSALPDRLLGLVDAAGGWPLYVEELLDDLRLSGALVLEDTRWTVTATAPATSASLRSASEGRLRALSPWQRQVVERAAVLGVRIDVGLLAAALDVRLDEVLDAVRAAVAVGLLDVAPAGGSVGFRHELLRASVLGTLVDVQRSGHATALLGAALAAPDSEGGPAGDDDPDGFGGLGDARIALAARLADDTRRRDLAGRLLLTLSSRLIRRGLPLAAAQAAARAAAHDDVREDALALQVEALALAGDVDAALAAAARLDALSHRPARPRVVESVARATAHGGDWRRAKELLAVARADDEPAGTTAFAALVDLELGELSTAAGQARRVLDGRPDPSSACQAMEVLGRVARTEDLDAAAAWFDRAVVLAQENHLALWRARALHEAATVTQLRSLDLDPLHLARAAAVDAGAPGLVSSVDFHLAAVHGVRFEADEALRYARSLLGDARAQGAVRLQAWAWLLIGQGHAVAGHRTQAALAAREALGLAASDAEIAGVADGTCRGLASLLADDPDAALAQWSAGIAALRTLPAPGPLPPWYLWALLATVADVEGDGGRRARAETAHPALRVLPGIGGMSCLAEAVALGRAGDVEGARAAAARSCELLDEVPAFTGWRLLGYRWAAQDAARAGWGDPAAWMTQASQWFSARGFDALAGACRGLATKSGAPARRRGRGTAQVPAHLHRVGVTSREVDVLRLVADGLSNAQIAQRLYLSPTTVKGYVEQLLAKTGTANRTQLAARLAADPGPPQAPSAPAAPGRTRPPPRRSGA